MARFSEKDLKLLGYTNIKERGSSSEYNPDWKIFSAETVAGIKKVKHEFAYLYSRCSQENAKILKSSVKTPDNFFIITTKSGLSSKFLQSAYPQDVAVHIYEDLIWEKIKTIFQEYVNALNAGITTEKYYVTPRSEGAHPSRDRLDETIISYLEGKENAERIRVVSASAGVGKTTLSRHVITKLAKNSAKNHVIPTYLESSHWGKLQLKSVEDLWEIIHNSLIAFSPNLTITEDLFKHALTQGWLVFVFDGFDELCGQHESHFRAREVLDWLINIAKETDARIVITTRTLFWDKEVGETSEVVLQKLLPFQTPQAKDYFQKFFPEDNKSADRSVTLYKQLIEKSQRPRESGGGRVQFVNLPLCVGMIAQFVGGGGNLLEIGGGGTLIEQFLTQILQRERARQQLETSAKDQLSAFEEIAVDSVYSRYTEFELELLLLPVPGFVKSDISRLNVHPFLQATDNKKYRFSYAFLEPYLLASYLAKHISQIPVDNRSIWSIMEREANGKGYVIEHLVEILGTDSLENVERFYHSVPSKHFHAKSFLFHVAKTMVEESINLVTMKEKTDALLGIVGGTLYGEKRILQNLFIIGTVDKLDFSGVIIQNSEFRDVAFHKCGANSLTRFVDCRFSGDLSLEGSDKKHWAQVVLEDNCVCDRSANLVWGGILSSPISNKEEYIKDAMSLALEKFWHHGRFKASIRKQNWSKGTLGHSVYCKPILQVMLNKGLLSEASISGVHEGGYYFVRKALPDLQRFMDNRQLTGLIKEVYKTLLNQGN